MLDLSEIKSLTSSIKKKYLKEKAESTEILENLTSSRYQLRVLSSEVSTFKKEIDDALKNAKNQEEILAIVMTSLDQIVKFTIDRPSILDFKIENAEQKISNINNFLQDIDILEKTSKKRIEQLRRIKEELRKDPDAYSKRTPGKRPEKIKDVRKIKAQLKDELASEIDSNEKEILDTDNNSE